MSTTGYKLLYFAVFLGWALLQCIAVYAFVALHLNVGGWLIPFWVVFVALASFCILRWRVRPTVSRLTSFTTFLTATTLRLLPRRVRGFPGIVKASDGDPVLGGLTYWTIYALFMLSGVIIPGIYVYTASQGTPMEGLGVIAWTIGDWMILMVFGFAGRKGFPLLFERLSKGGSELLTSGWDKPSGRRPRRRRRR